MLKKTSLKTIQQPCFYPCKAGQTVPVVVNEKETSLLMDN
jgi:hypothetical protein